MRSKNVGGVMLVIVLLAALAVLPLSVAAQTKPYEGVTLRVGAGSFAAKSPRMLESKWEEMTGADVKIIEIPFGELYEKLVSTFAMGVKAYDVIIYPSNWIADFVQAGWVISLEKYWDKKSDWEDVIPLYRKMQFLEGKPYSIPVDGDIIFGYYRKDALEVPEYQKKFEDKYGYPLAPPKTWKEYKDIAEFFNGWDWDKDGKTDYGALEALLTRTAGPYIFIVRAASRAAHPDNPATLFFDPVTMKPNINNPGWVRALEEWLEIKKYGSPEMVNYGLGEVRGYYIGGESALAIDWADIGIMAQDPVKSRIRGKIGYFLAPGSYEYWNVKTKKWDRFDEVTYAPYIGWSGWCASVTSTSENVEAAFSFADFLDTEENALEGVTTPATARNPYRYSQVDNPKAWKESPINFVNPEEYLKVNKMGYEHPNAQLDLRIPKAGRYFEALARYLSEAIAGTLTPKEALDEAAKEWDRITEEMGRDQQRKFYRATYGLPPLK